MSETEAKAIDKAEYRRMYSEFRKGYRYTFGGSLIDHFNAAHQAAADIKRASDYPDWFQYVPVSKKYRDYHYEQIADWGGSQQEIELERQAEAYHRGYGENPYRDYIDPPADF